MLRAEDMIVRDAEGIIASVAYGPAERTRLRLDSDAAFFGAWPPVGITAGAVTAHLEKIAALLRREWPGVTVDAPKILCAKGRS
jgi:hypothetical protein